MRKILLIWAWGHRHQLDYNSPALRNSQSRASSHFFRPHKKALTKGVSASAMGRQVQSCWANIRVTIIPSDRMESSREVAVRAGAQGVPEGWRMSKEWRASGILLSLTHLPGWPESRNKYRTCSPQTKGRQDASDLWILDDSPPEGHSPVSNHLLVFCTFLKKNGKKHKKHYTGQRTGGWVWTGAQ